MRYIFIFGRNPELSRFELESYLASHSIEYNEISSGKRGIVLEFNKILNSGSLIKELGGTLKICEVIESKEKLFFQDKFKWGISVYESSISFSKIKEDFKQFFKKSKVKAMFYWPSRGGKGVKELNPTDVVTKNLFEIVAFKDFIGKTVSVFNPKLFEQRDLGRPNVEHLHVISIRLARILLNLAGIKPGINILDPFCGVGTILQEALFIGANASGVDIDLRMTNASDDNLKWFSEKYKISASWDVTAGDARSLTNYYSKNSFDCIVTEPYLGPLLKKVPSINEVRKIVSELNTLYSAVFEQFLKVLKPEGKVVIILPEFMTEENKVLALNKDYITESFEILNEIPYFEERHKLKRVIYVLKPVA